MSSQVCTYSPPEDANYYLVNIGDALTPRTQLFRVDRATRHRTTLADVADRYSGATMAVAPDPKANGALRLFVLRSDSRIDVFNPNVVEPVSSPLEKRLPEKQDGPDRVALTVTLTTLFPCWPENFRPTLCAFDKDLSGSHIVVRLARFDITDRTWSFSRLPDALVGAKQAWYDAGSRRLLVETAPELALGVASVSEDGSTAFIGSERILPFRGTSCLGYDPAGKAIHAGGVVTPFDLASFD